MNNLKNKLIQLGLEQKEAIIYLAALSLGKTSILKISQNTAASRYRYGLEALKKHLASIKQSGDIL